jgi:hypothetical protein
MENNLKPCEKCGKIPEKFYGSGRFCSQPCARSTSTSKKRKEINEKVSKKLMGQKGWSAGKTFEKRYEITCAKCGKIFLAASKTKKWCDEHRGGRETPEYLTVEDMSEEEKKRYDARQKRNFIRKQKRPFKMSEEKRKQISEMMKKRIAENPEAFMGGRRGRVKQVIMDGIKLQGKWEVEFYKWAKINGLNPQRCTRGFPYEWNGSRTYFPDFYLPNLDLYIEVKGYERERDLAKWSQFPEKLIVLKKQEIEEIKKGTFSGLC